MTNEIKELIDKLKDNDWYEVLDLTGTKWIELKQEETNQLLDYITNLQEENKHLNLQLDQALKDYEELQIKIDKAVEYINGFESIKAYYEYEECGYTEYNYDESFKQDLLDILRGDE